MQPQSRCRRAISIALVLASTTTLGAERAIEEVIVTAQKRTESAQDVPMSIEVLQGSEIEDFQVIDLQSLQNYVPNLLVQSSPGNDAIFIRGFGSQAANYGFDQSVSMYVDGIYGGRSRQFMAPFFDVERIEVMRGPQGALLGKNTAAGAVSIVTAGPTETLEGRIASSYNIDRHGYDVNGYVSGPMTDNWSGRLAARYTDLDGYIDNIAVGTPDPTRLDNAMVRGSLKFAPGDRLDIDTKVEYVDFETIGTSAVRVSPLGAVLDDRKNAGPAIYHPEEDRQEAVNVSVNADVLLGEHTLTLITGYSAFENDKWVGGSANNPEHWLSTFHEDFDQVSQEIRLASLADRTVEYIVGAYFDRSSYDLFNGSEYREFTGVPGFDGGIHSEFSQDFKTLSAFGMGTWHVTPRLRVSGSLRYTDNRKDGSFDQFADYGIPIGAPVSLDERIDENNIDPSLSVQFDLRDGLMVFANYGQGSKAGGFVAQRTASANAFTFDREQSTNYEVGFKSLWLDDSVLVNVTLYDLQFEDLQVSFYDPSIAGFITGNAAEATSRGLEAEAMWRPSPNLRISGSLAYLDAEYEDFPGAQCPATGTVCDPLTNTTNLAGTTILGASKWTGNLRGTWERPLTDSLHLSLTVVGYYRSRYTTASDQNPAYGVQDGYDKWDMRIELASASGGWGVAAVGRNVTNELTHNFAYLWPLQPPPTGVQFLDEPRTWSIEAYWEF